MEDWQEIRSFPNYSVSTLGHIRNEKTGRPMALLKNQYGVINVGLTKDRVQCKRSVALLVATAFLPNGLDAFDTPINLDGQRSNNRIDNLVWRPRWFATKYFQQFHPNALRGFPTPIEDINTGEYFETSWKAATKYGLIDRQIFIATINHTHVWPTYQQFRQI